jgi:hypothetical protein
MAGLASEDIDGVQGLLINGGLAADSEMLSDDFGEAMKEIDAVLGGGGGGSTTPSSAGGDTNYVRPLAPQTPPNDNGNNK